MELSEKLDRTEFCIGNSKFICSPLTNGFYFTIYAIDNKKRSKARNLLE